MTPAEAQNCLNDRWWLDAQYTVRGHGLVTIGRTLDVGRNVVRDALVGFDIPIRPKNGARCGNGEPERVKSKNNGVENRPVRKFDLERAINLVHVDIHRIVEPLEQRIAALEMENARLRGDVR